MATPLTLDYEMNDPADPEGVYTRSDHYSYAAKGIPVAFFTTGVADGSKGSSRYSAEEERIVRRRR